MCHFKEVFKSFKEEEKLILYHTIEESLTKWQERIPDFGVYTIPSLEKDLACKIIENIEYIETESNLLHDFGICRRVFRLVQLVQVEPV